MQNLVHSLYDLALRCGPAQLRKDALALVANHVDADFAFWTSGDLVQGHQVITTYNWQGPLPSYETAQDGVVFRKVVESQDRALIIRDALPLDEILNDPSYIESLGPQGMRHALVMSNEGLDQIADLRHIICFSRNDEDRPFTEPERVSAEVLLSTIDRVVTHNLEVMALKYGFNGNAVAVCNWQGQIYLQNGPFEQVMKMQFGGADKQLPLKFPANGNVKTVDEWQFARHYLEFDQHGLVEEQRAYFLVTVNRASGLEQLSKREAEITKRVAAGESYKVVAAGLGIAASTVGNSMRRVYQKLDVQNRAGLIALINGDG